MRVAGRLDECADLPLEQAHTRMRSLPGIGVWTAAEVAQRALGDPDSPSFGDYHVAKDVTPALDGEIGDDARMAELLAPYAGHRYRAQRIIQATAGHRPRRGPPTLAAHAPADALLTRGDLTDGADGWLAEGAGDTGVARLMGEAGWRTSVRHRETGRLRP
uniref:Uncharacterized protein n=1 Tax=Janibacter limosus TaxID=53458 RepID=A0AC61U1V7_9MICO|nr:hypothetical protein [Janibacter limosus]